MNFSFLLSLLLGMRIISPDPVETEITIRNIKMAKGSFIISFYDDGKAFPKVGKELLTETVTVHDTVPHTVRVKLPHDGWYAIAMFQDEDGNRVIKQDKVGIPQEPYAFSNNIHPRVAAPTFTLCKFYVGQKPEINQEIRLIQPKFGGKL